MQIVGALWIRILLDNKKSVGIELEASSPWPLSGPSVSRLDWHHTPPLFDWADGPFGDFFVLNPIFGMNLVVLSRFLLIPPLSNGNPNRSRNSFRIVPTDRAVHPRHLYHRPGRASSSRGLREGVPGSWHRDVFWNGGCGLDAAESREVYFFSCRWFVWSVWSSSPGGV